MKPEKHKPSPVDLQPVSKPDGRKESERSSSFGSTLLRIAYIAIPILLTIAAIASFQADEESEPKHALVISEPSKAQVASLNPQTSVAIDGVQAVISPILSILVALKMRLDNHVPLSREISLSSSRDIDRAKIREKAKTLQRLELKEKKEQQSRLVAKIEHRFQMLEEEISYLEPDHPLQDPTKAFRRQLDDCKLPLDSKKKRFIPKNKLKQIQKDLRSLEAKLSASTDIAGRSRYLDALLEIPAARQIDDKLFQHVLGDYWGQLTGLEGYSSLNMLRHFLSSIKAQIAAFEKSDLNPPEILQSMQSLFNEGIELTASFGSGEIFFTKLANLLRRKQKGERCFFVGGWEKSVTGHAIVLEITSQGENLYSLRIFNRGDGVDYHGMRAISGKLQAFPFFEITDISEESITDPIFLKALQEMQRPATRGEGWKACDFYEGILPLLGKTATIGPYPAEMTRELLMVGHCSYLSVESFVHSSMPEISLRFILNMQLKTLSDFFAQNQEVLLHDIPKRRLLVKGCEALSRYAEKALAEKKITPGEMRQINLQVSKALRFLKEGSDSLPAQLAWDQEPKTSGVEKPPAFETESFLEGRKMKLSDSGMFVDISHFRPSLKSFASDCQQWQKQFATMIDQKHFIETREAIKDWMRKIPIEWLQTPDVFTQPLSPEEAADTLEILAEIAKDFLWADMHTHNEDYEEESRSQVSSNFRRIETYEYYHPSSRMGTQDPATLFAMIKLLTFSDKLSKDFEDSTGVSLPGLYQYDFDLLFEQSGSMLFFDPELEEQTSYLKTYWEQADPEEKRVKRNYLSFFGVEVNPTFVGGRLHFEASPDSCIDTFRWPYLAWIEESYLSHPAIVERIKNEFPQLENLPTRARAIESLTSRTEKTLSSEENKSLLPKSYWALYDISWATNILFMPPHRTNGLKREEIFFPAPMVPKEGFKGDSFNFDAPQMSDKCSVPVRTEKFRPFGRNFNDWYIMEPLYSTSEVSNYQDLPAGTRFESLKKGDSNRYIENTQDLPGSLTSLYGRKRALLNFQVPGLSLVRFRMGPELRGRVPLAFAQGAETIQDLLALSSVREFQVVQTLAYFTQHP